MLRQPLLRVRQLRRPALGQLGARLRHHRLGAGPLGAQRPQHLRHPELQIRALAWWDVSPRVVDAVYADAIEGTLRSFHANDAETSVYLAHSPHLVHTELAQLWAHMALSHQEVAWI